MYEKSIVMANRIFSRTLNVIGRVLGRSQAQTPNFFVPKAKQGLASHKRRKKAPIRKKPPIKYTYIPRDEGEVGRAAVIDRPARVYAFGSSSTEVLDYVFGPSPRFRSYWASGWSARGLRKLENRDYVMQCLRGAAVQDIIFLHYGVADAVFNSAYRMQKGDFMDPEGFCQEAADGIAQLVDDLKAAGFHNVYPLCVGAPCRVPRNYFWSRFKMHGLPMFYQAKLLNRMSELVAQRCELLDLSPVLADKNGLMKRKFLRYFPTHHADYTRIQEIVWDGIRHIPGMPPHRATWRSCLYRGGVRGNVSLRIEAKNFGAIDLSQFENPIFDKPRPSATKGNAGKRAANAKASKG